METHAQLVKVALVILTLARIGDALKCYECNSQVDNQCIKEVDNSMLSSGSNEEPCNYCFKYQYEFIGRKVVQRGCLTEVPSHGEENKCIGIFHYSIEGTYCTCEGGKCNTGTTSALSLVAAITMILVILLL